MIFFKKTRKYLFQTLKKDGARRAGAGPNLGRSVVERTIQPFLTVQYSFFLRPQKSNMQEKGSQACLPAGLHTRPPAARTCPRLLVLAGHSCHRAHRPLVPLASAASARHGCSSNIGGFHSTVDMVVTSPMPPSPAHRLTLPWKKNLKQQKIYYLVEAKTFAGSSKLNGGSSKNRNQTKISCTG